MHKQIKSIPEWLSSKSVLLFVLIFSMTLLGISIFFWAQKINLSYLALPAFILPYFSILFFLLKVIHRAQKISEELQTRKENYRITLNSLGEAMISTDKEGYIQYMNPVAEKLTGWRWQEAKKQPLHQVFNVISEDTGQPFEHIVSRILKSGKTIGLENNTILKAKDSGSFIISNNGSPIFDINGNISGAVLVFSDITEKYRIEKQLKHNEEKYRSLIEQASDAILIYSFDGTIHEFNKCCYTMLGYTAGEYAKLKLTDILVDDIIVNQDNYAAILAGETKTLYRHLMRKDGTLMETEVTVKLLEDGKAIAFARDITERKKAELAIKESEAKYRSLIELAADGIFVFDQQGNVLSANTSGCRMVGHDIKDLLKMNLQDITPPEYYGKQPIKLSKVNEIGHLMVERQIMRKDGSIFFTEVSVQILADKNLLVIVRDITERKKAEQALKESEKELRYMAESMPQIVWITRADGWNIYFNQQWMDYTGLSLEESYGHGWNKPFHPDDQQRALDAWQNAVQYQVEYVLECRLRKHDGTFQWWLIRGVPQIGDNGEIIKWHGTCTDIEKIKQQEEAIKKEKELSDSVIKSLPGVFYFYDEHLKLLRWNKQLENVTGYSAAELSAMNPAELFTGEDRTYMQERSRKVFASGSGDAETNFTTKSGKKIPFYFTGVRMQYEDKPTLLGIGIDITERKIAEKEIRDYKLALDESSLVDISDHQGIIRHANENFCKLSKYSKAELIGQDHRILNSGYHPAALFQDLWNTVGEGKIWRNEVRNRAKDGSFFWVDTTIVPFLDNDGKPFQFITIRNDITNRKNAEARMAEAVERYDILADATSDTIWDWDIVNNTMLYNQGITKMFGYKAAEVENVVDWWNEKLHLDDFSKVTESLHDIFEKGQQRFQLTYRFRCADDSYKHIFDRAFIVFDEQGKPSRMIGAMQDITYQVEEEIRISKAILDAQEDERRYIGEELHDNVNQILVGSLLNLTMVKENKADGGKSTEFINATKGYIGNAIDEIRKLSHQLAPATFDDNSLKDIFENLLFDINLDNRFTINLHFEELNEKVIPDDVQINFYRILQEQTKNILKYAEASIIEIAVTLSGNMISLRIFDNGKGFNTMASKNGIGLGNIKKRAESLSGKFILNSAPGKGCEIIVEIPLAND